MKLPLCLPRLSPLLGWGSSRRHSKLEPAATLSDNFLRLNPGARENARRTALASFQFRAEAVLRLAGALSEGKRGGDHRFSRRDRAFPSH
ncbi:hypothetical protein [Bosea beijingensis]